MIEEHIKLYELIEDKHKKKKMKKETINKREIIILNAETFLQRV